MFVTVNGIRTRRIQTPAKHLFSQKALSQIFNKFLITSLGMIEKTVLCLMLFYPCYSHLCMATNVSLSLFLISAMWQIHNLKYLKKERQQRAIFLEHMNLSYIQQIIMVLLAYCSVTTLLLGLLWFLQPTVFLSLWTQIRINRAKQAHIYGKKTKLNFRIFFLLSQRQWWSSPIHLKSCFNPLQPGVPFLYPLKTSENLQIV